MSESGLHFQGSAAFEESLAASSIRGRPDLKVTSGGALKLRGGQPGNGTALTLGETDS